MTLMFLLPNSITRPITANYYQTYCVATVCRMTGISFYHLYVLQSNNFSRGESYFQVLVPNLPLLLADNLLYVRVYIWQRHHCFQNKLPLCWPIYLYVLTTTTLCISTGNSHSEQAKEFGDKKVKMQNIIWGADEFSVLFSFQLLTEPKAESTCHWGWSIHSQ